MGEVIMVATTRRSVRLFALGRLSDIEIALPG